jgi:hypothetical protein
MKGILQSEALDLIEEIRDITPELYELLNAEGKGLQHD